MRKSHLFGLALLAVFAFGVTVVSSAFAESLPQLLVNGAVIPLGTSVNVVALPENEPLFFEDTSQGIGYDCVPAETSLGFALSNGVYEQVTAACASVTVLKGTCEGATVTAVNLPWVTALSEPEPGVFMGTIKAAEPGPGWAVLCLVLGIDVTDTCTTQLGLVWVLNEEDGLLHIEFPPAATLEKSQFANCSVGSKKEVGIVEGLFWFHALDAEGELIPLAVSLEEDVA